MERVSVTAVTLFFLLIAFFDVKISDQLVSLLAAADGSQITGHWWRTGEGFIDRHFVFRQLGWKWGALWRSLRKNFVGFLEFSSDEMHYYSPQFFMRISVSVVRCHMFCWRHRLHCCWLRQLNVVIVIWLTSYVYLCLGTSGTECSGCLFCWRHRCSFVETRPQLFCPTRGSCFL